jgi:hypothetical protein
MVDEHAINVAESLDLYRSRPMTVGCVGALVGRSSLETWGHADIGIEKSSAVLSEHPEERNREQAALQDARAVVADPTCRATNTSASRSTIGSTSERCGEREGSPSDSKTHRRLATPFEANFELRASHEASKEGVPTGAA